MLIKIALLGTVGLVLLGAVAFYVNYYYYSWTSFVHPFGCRCKQITGKNTNRLEQTYDLVKIGEQAKSSDKYESVYYNQRRVSATRVYGSVKYIVRIDYYTTSTGNFFELSVGHGYTEEPKTTPNYYIQQNINQMIDEMPLSNEQKEDLKGKVTVDCRQELTITF